MTELHFLVPLERGDSPLTDNTQNMLVKIKRNWHVCPSFFFIKTPCIVYLSDPGSESIELTVYLILLIHWYISDITWHNDLIVCFRCFNTLGKLVIAYSFDHPYIQQVIFDVYFVIVSSGLQTHIHWTFLYENHQISNQKGIFCFNISLVLNQSFK